MKMMGVLVVGVAVLITRMAGAGDIWRAVDGEASDVLEDERWFRLEGRVIQTFKTGVLVSGTASKYGQGWRDAIFAVRNVNWIDDDVVPADTWVRQGGTMEYTTVLGSKKTIRVFDFGLPAAAPKKEVYVPIIIKTPVQLEEEKKIDANRLKFTLSQATNGVASAQYDLAMRYLEGRGVEKDESTARAWLEKAASKNHAYAKRALATLGVKE